jgi:site-specific recombinase XerD
MTVQLSSDSIEQFQDSLSARGRSWETCRAYGQDLRTFLDWSGQCSLSPTQVELHGQKWLNEYRRVVSPKTTARRLTSLRSFGKHNSLALLQDYCPPSPARPMPHPIPEGQAGILKMLDSTGNHEMQALVALCGLCGLRVSEARDVKPADFDLNEMLLKVRGKGDKTRVIPVSKLAWEHLSHGYMRAWERNENLVTYGDRGARYAITRIAQKAGLRRAVTSHDLRATFATHVYDATLNIRVVQELMGHSSSETTEIYTLVKVDTMRAAVEL